MYMNVPKSKSYPQSFNLTKHANVIAYCFHCFQFQGYIGINIDSSQASSSIVDFVQDIEPASQWYGNRSGHTLMDTGNSNCKQHWEDQIEFEVYIFNINLKTDSVEGLQLSVSWGEL